MSRLGFLTTTTETVYARLLARLEGLTDEELLRDDLQNLAESDLDQPRRTNWGDRWPAWRIFWAMTDHDSLPGGVIGHMRDIYYWSRTGSVPKTLG